MDMKWKIDMEFCFKYGYEMKDREAISLDNR